MARRYCSSLKILLQIFLFISLHDLHSSRIGCSAKILIWDKTRQDFVLLTIVPTLSSYQSGEVKIGLGRSQKARELETHDFNGEVVTVGYFQEPPMFMFFENDTRIGGVHGELWNIMADYLNFTLKVERQRDHSFGKYWMSEYSSGLLMQLQLKQIDVLAKTGSFSHLQHVMDYMMPLWPFSYRTYVTPTVTYDQAGLSKIFPTRIWISIVVTIIVLSISGYAFEKIEYPKSYESVLDHLFYTFAVLCCQACAPLAYVNRFRILTLTKNVFSYIIVTIVSLTFFSYLSTKSIDAPIHDIFNSKENDDYNVSVVNGSQIANLMEIASWSSDIREHLKYFDSFQEIMTSVCNVMENNVAFLAEDSFSLLKFPCQVIPVGVTYRPSWASSGIRKEYKYKRTFDVAMVKMHEIGMVKYLRYHWKRPQHGVKEVLKTSVEPATLEQMIYIFLMLILSASAAILILVIERIIFRYRSTIRTRKQVFDTAAVLLGAKTTNRKKTRFSR